MPPDLGTQGQQLFDWEVDFLDRTLLMMDDMFTFDSIGAKYLNCGVGAWTGSAGVLRTGLFKGAWYMFLVENTSFSWTILDRTGFSRSVCLFPDAILFFLACNNSMYLHSSASGFSFPPSELSTPSFSLIYSRWAKDSSFLLLECPNHKLWAG